MKFVFNSNIFSLGVLIGLTFLLLSATNHYILTVDFYNVSGDPLSGVPRQDAVVYESLQKWIYLSTAAYLTFKLASISLILYTAVYLSGQEVSFSKVFIVVTYSEYIFFIPALLKIIFFHIYFVNGTLSDWQKFYPFSLLNIIGNATPDWYYSLQTLNLFEVGYWFLLAFGISRITRLDFDHSLKTVFFSYLPALFIWICCVEFCTLMLIPGYF